LAGVILNGRSPWQSRARAAVSLVLIRSAIDVRSNLARTTNMPNISQSFEVVVPIAAEPVELPHHQRVAAA
jgi:hypothetical protein